MTKPNAQYPRGRKSTKKRDEAQYEEDREKLETDEKQDSVSKHSKN